MHVNGILHDSDRGATARRNDLVEAHGHHNEQMKYNTKGALCDSIYMKFNHRQKKLNVKEEKLPGGRGILTGHLGASGVLEMSCILTWLVAIYMHVHMDKIT